MKDLKDLKNNATCFFSYRQKVLEDIKLIPTCRTLCHMNYNFNLFKMETDCPSFEKFEELFNDEDGWKKDLPMTPTLNCDWKPKSNVRRICLN